MAYEEIRELVPSMFENHTMYVKKFKKAVYMNMIEQYLAENKDVFSLMKQALDESEDVEKTSVEIAAFFVGYVQSVLDGIKGKSQKDSMQLDMNMFMAIYLMPCVIEKIGEHGQEVADTIASAWASSFKNSNIKTSTISNIQSGFRTKLCYITTAVCESMHKPEDCYELTLLKDYRDNYLVNKNGGSELIHEYYDIAPTIVKRINKEQDAEVKYQWIYETYLKKCIQFIEEDHKEECEKIYTDMVNELRKEYMEDYRNE